MEEEWEYNGCIIPLDLYYDIETQTVRKYIDEWDIICMRCT